MKPVLIILQMLLPFLFCMSTGCTTSPEQQDDAHHYIAHGGGAIDGYLCTNSLEAVENSLANGINHIEVDLALTSDSVLVGSHDWDYFREISGLPRGNEAVDSATFVNARIFGRYTPLTASDLVGLLERHPSMTLVLDKISDPEIIDHHFSKFRNRVKVESFSYSDYKVLTDLGYRSFNNGLPPYTSVFFIKELLDFVRPNVRNYYLSIRSMSERFDGKPRWLYPDECTLALYSASDRTMADSLFEVYPNARFIYVDKVEE